jgi:hypothetical protein
MNQFRYNEKEYAELILKNGFLTQYHRYELKILVKYFKEELGEKASERKKLIYEFCENNIVNFNRVKYFKMINSALAYGSKRINKLILINSIPIVDKEIEYINGLELDDTHKKIMFTLLVKIKLNKEISKQISGESSKYNFFGGKNESYKEIFDMSKLSSEYNINSLINDLSNSRYVEVRTRGKINLLFIDNIKFSDNDKIIFNVSNFDNVGYYFEWFNGNDKFIKCGNNGCEEIIKKTNGNMKYCINCATEKEKTRKREWKRQNSSEAEKPCNPTLATV